MNTTIKILLIFTLAALVFSACESATTKSLSNAPQTPAVQNEIKQISVEQAKTAVETKDVQFIDVRTPEEYAGGRAPKAANFPLDVLDKDLIKLDQDKPVYVICQTGKRSQKGAEILQKAGFKDIYNINGGTSEWIKASFPTEK